MKINFKLEGTPNSPVLMLSNSLGAEMDMWDELVPCLLPFFRVLRYDTRGHGGSTGQPGEYTIDLLGNDVIELLDRLDIPEVFFCGPLHGRTDRPMAGHPPPEAHQKADP